MKRGPQIRQVKVAQYLRRERVGDRAGNGGAGRCGDALLGERPRGDAGGERSRRGMEQVRGAQGTGFSPLGSVPVRPVKRG